MEPKERCLEMVKKTSFVPWEFRKRALGALVCAFFVTGISCSDDDGDPETCGDGRVGAFEVCDGEALQGETCVSQGYLGGELGCRDDCLEFDTSGCEEAQCGDDVAEGDEACDGDDLADKTCESLGFSGGELGCTAQCEFDLSTCGAGCGNGLREGEEDCDGSDLGMQTCVSLGFSSGDLSCDETCGFVLEGCIGGCGNGVMEEGEECDEQDLGGSTCEDFGYGEGTLECDEDCSVNVAGCEGAGEAVGGACVQSEDCAQGVCVTELEYGWPAGYCLDMCQGDGTCLDVNATCVFIQDYFLCLKSCDPQGGMGECRPGYVCEEVGSGDSACLPACEDDDQCVMTHICDDVEGSETEGLCVTPQETCDNGADDDLDGFTDCGDVDCNGVCPQGEICDSGSDDDGDGLVDCDDGECLSHVVCTGIACDAVQELECGDILVAETNDATGSTTSVNRWCGAGVGSHFGPEYGYRMEVVENTVVVLRAEGLTGDLDLMVLRDDGTQGCNPQTCWAVSMNLQPNTSFEEVVFEANPGYVYYAVVDGWQGDISQYDLTVDCYQGEVCDNGVDDDGDGLVDCGDDSCFGQSACAQETVCYDLYDNDLDGVLDCDDPDCAAHPYCNAERVLEEGFSPWGAGGWTVEDGQSDGFSWQECDPSSGCDKTLLLHNGPYALVDSDAADRKSVV